MDKKLVQEIIDRSLSVSESGTGPSDRFYQFINWAFNPYVTGTENIPQRPVLFVGNHAAMAFDMLVIDPVIVRECGRYPFSMSHQMLWSNEGRREQLYKRRVILGHPEVCGAMMEAGRDLLLFPGGSGEANKPLDQRYSLRWKDRLGFMKLAVTHNYPIVPFAVVGPEEWYDRYMDPDELANSRFGRLIKAAGLVDQDSNSENWSPVPKGLFGTFIPKPQRVFISFGRAITFDEYKGKPPGTATLRKKRDKVARSIEAMISDMLLARARSQQNDGWVRKFLTR